MHLQYILLIYICNNLLSNVILPFFFFFKYLSFRYNIKTPFNITNDLLQTLENLLAVDESHISTALFIKMYETENENEIFQQVTEK